MISEFKLAIIDCSQPWRFLAKSSVLSNHKSTTNLEFYEEKKIKQSKTRLCNESFSIFIMKK
jgi:hypothetical protein